MNRKRLFLALALGIALVLLCASAALADDPMKVSMELSTTKFTGPKTITVSITVTNVGDGDMPGPVTLYYPSGKQVEAFGSPTLSVGASKNWSGDWTVTQKELDAGKITFKIKYSVYGDDVDDEGEPKLLNKTKNFSKKIQYSGAEPELTINRIITPTTAQKGQEVSVTYEITNTGTTEVSSVNIKENSSISNKTGTIDKIAVGETESYTFTVAMGNKDLTSAAAVSYKAGGKTFTKKVESEKIKYGEVKLTASLTADKKGGAPGDTVKLTLKLKNTGKTDATNVTVTDPALGTVFSGETVKAGESLTLEKDLPITVTQELQFTVKADDGTPEGIETATGRVKIIATDPTQQIVLSLEAEADRSVVYKLPGAVRFSFTLHNDSAVEVKDITVKAVEEPLYTIESIPAGGSISFIRDTNVSMEGTYQFTASCKDQLGQTLNFMSDPIVIAYSQPTAVPTEAPLFIPTPPPDEPMPTKQAEPEWLEQAENIAGIAKWPLMGVGGVLLLLLLIGAIRRIAGKNQSRKAMDHLEGATYRDYGATVKRRRRSEIASGPETEKGSEQQTENTVQNSELMAETLRRLYTDKPKGETEILTEAAEQPETAAPEAAETTEAGNAPEPPAFPEGFVPTAQQPGQIPMETPPAAQTPVEIPDQTSEPPQPQAAEDVNTSRRRRSKKEK